MRKILALLLIVCLYAGCGAPPAATSSFSINSFSANPTTIAAGDKTVLTWSVSGATSVTIDQGVGTVSSSGNLNVQPTKDSVYTLTASDGVNSAKTAVSISVKGGTSASSKSKSKTPAATAAPSPPANTPVVTIFTSTPSILDSGGRSTLKWDVTNATSITISPLVGPVKNTGTAQVSPGTSTTYTLTASNPQGSISASTTIMLRCAKSTLKPVILSFTANPSMVVENSTSTLSWSIFGATSENLSPVEETFGSTIGRVTAIGSKTVIPGENSTYTLTAANTAGVTTATVDLTVVLSEKLPVIRSFTASPMTIIQGNSTLLTWDVDKADIVALNGEAVDYNDSRIISPSATTTYTLSLSNEWGNISRAVKVTVLTYNSKYFMPLVTP